MCAEEVCLPDLGWAFPHLDIQPVQRESSPGVSSSGELFAACAQFTALVCSTRPTSALDVTTEKQPLLPCHRAGSSFVSVGHRPTLAAFHDTVSRLMATVGGGQDSLGRL